MGRALCVLFSLAVAPPVFSIDLPPPVQSLVVPFGGEAEILLCDPQVAENLDFEITEHPSHGVLTGAPPRLVYEPEGGFHGEDSFKVAVYDAQTGELLEEIRVDVVVLGPGGLAEPPTFIWSGEIGFSGLPFSLEKSEFAGELRLDLYYFDLNLRAKFVDGMFSNLEGSLRYFWEFAFDDIAVKIPLTLTTVFDPIVPALESWRADLRTSVMGYTLEYKFYFDGENPQDSYSYFNLSGRLGDVSFSGRAEFAGLTVEFSELKLTARGKAAVLGCTFCDFRWDISFAFSKDEGFESFSVTFGDLPVPCGVCGELEISLDLKLTFTPDSKDIAPNLRASLGWIRGCIRPRLELQAPEEGFGLEGLHLYGIEVKCEFAGEISGKFVTSLDPDKDASLTGDPAFFEYWLFEGPVEGCCGEAGRWQFAFYFGRGNDDLFGLEKLKASLVFPLIPKFTARFGLEAGLVDPGDPAKTWLLTFGWKATF